MRTTKRSDSLVLSLLRERDPLSDNVCAQLLEIRSETRVLDFKEMFDPNSNGDWCELIKDLVAMSNTDGGYIIVGATDNGTSSKHGLSAAASLDQAVMIDKIGKYTDMQPDEVNVKYWRQGKTERVIFHVGASEMPIVFTKPGTYSVSSKKQKSAFSAGTIYFRHGSKSEPARQTDLQRTFDSLFTKRKREILSGVQKVVKAKSDEQVVVLPKSVRLTQDPAAPAVRLTNDPAAPSLRGFVGSGKYCSEDEELAAAVRNYETDPEAYAAEAQLWRFYAHREQIDCNENAFRCLLVSSMYRHCPPYYWAYQLGLHAVAEICLAEAQKDKYPGIQVVVRLAFTIGGTTGRKILEQIGSRSKYLSVSKLANRLLTKSVLPWRVWDEYGSRAITIRTNTGSEQNELSKDYLDLIELLIDEALPEKENRDKVKRLDALVYGTKLERQDLKDD